MLKRLLEIHPHTRDTGGWTWHLFMSIVTENRRGQWNLLGRVYWPLHDRVRTVMVNR